jgi:hypothetical protein
MIVMLQMASQPWQHRKVSRKALHLQRLKSRLTDLH